MRRGEKTVTGRRERKLRAREDLKKRIRNEGREMERRGEGRSEGRNWQKKKKS